MATAVGKKKGGGYVPPPKQTVLGHPVYYRTWRGGRIPFTQHQCKQLLELYDDHGRPVTEIAFLFGVKTHTIYRVLLLLGVSPQQPKRKGK